jgi:hypothetical protein
LHLQLTARDLRASELSAAKTALEIRAVERMNSQLQMQLRILAARGASVPIGKAGHGSARLFCDGARRPSRGRQRVPWPPPRGAGAVTRGGVRTKAALAARATAGALVTEVPVLFGCRGHFYAGG